MDFISILHNRRSTRAYLPDPMDRGLLEQVLTDAAHAASAMNMQPWEVHVVLDEERRRLSTKLMRHYRERQVTCGTGATSPLPERFIARARECGEGMTPLIHRMGREFKEYVNEGSLNFYGAPAVAFIFLEEAFPGERMVDIGVFTGYLVLAAAYHGLGTCPIGLVRAYEDAIKDHLNIPESKTLAIAVAIGRPDPDAAINEFRSSRVALEEFVRWI
jgi:nitroreductase